MLTVGGYSVDDDGMVRVGDRVLFRADDGGERLWMVGFADRGTVAPVAHALDRSGQFAPFPNVMDLLEPFVAAGLVVEEPLASSPTDRVFDVVDGARLAPVPRAVDRGMLF